MTTVQDLPEEILYTIFKQCEQSDVNNFQRVCRNWYYPAHITLLKEIEVFGVPAIQQFIDSIDCNPDPAYLKAVKKIKLNAKSDPFQLNDELNQKLFYRFPNLEKVLLDDPAMLENFSDEMCETFLEKCSKLEMFSAKNDDHPDPTYHDLDYKAKLLVSRINLENFDNESTPVNLIQFLRNFPRLKWIDGYDNTILTNFSQLLQILEHAPNLTSFHMGPGYDSKNAAEKYLTSKPKDEQDTLIKRLSKIEQAIVNNRWNFCVNSLRFVLKYLTGLELIFFTVD